MNPWLVSARWDMSVFGGSARKLVMHAVQSQKISRDELAEIRKMLDQLDKDKK